MSSFMAVQSPWFFWLLLPLILGFAFLYFNRKKMRPSLQFSHLSEFMKTHSSLRSQLSRLPVFFKGSALALIVVALARPQSSFQEVKKYVEGIDIVVALDVSDSMLIEDMIPENRLESSKETIKRFIQKRQFDRIGLLVFSGESYTRVPLTLDYPLLLKSLREVETSKNIKVGTAIGVALANAVSRLKDSTAKSRVIIFLTDGESNSGTISPQTAIDIAKGYGVKIYSIGMGRDGMAQLPVYVQTLDGRTIKRYRPMHSKVNEKLLSQMARETGGKYYRASTTDALKKVFENIDQLEKTKIETNQYTRYDEKFRIYLSAALWMYLLSFALSWIALRRGP